MTDEKRLALMAFGAGVLAGALFEAWFLEPRHPTALEKICAEVESLYEDEVASQDDVTAPSRFSHLQELCEHAPGIDRGE
jgi:hypothetical protein